MLDLQAANRASAHVSSDGGADESIVFQRIVGSLGASISPEQFSGPSLHELVDDMKDDAFSERDADDIPAQATLGAACDESQPAEGC